MSSLPLNCVSSKNTVTESSSTSHILSAENHIQQAIDNMTYSKSHEELIDCPELSKLQFIICQLRTVMSLKQAALQHTNTNFSS